MCTTQLDNLQVDYCTLSAVMSSAPEQPVLRNSTSHTPTLYLPEGSYDIVPTHTMGSALNIAFWQLGQRGKNSGACKLELCLD